MRPRKRAAGLAVGAAVLFVIGTNIQAGWLFVLAALLLGALAAGAACSVVCLRGLTVDLVAPAEAVQASDVPVTIVVRNRSRAMRAGMTVRDSHLADAIVDVGTLPPGARVEATTVRVPARRGDLQTTTADLRSSAPFGVVERRRRVPVGARTLVLPQVLPIERPWFVETIAASEPTTRTAPARGLGAEYLSVRAYRPGDPMRHVHWGLTARHGQLMVREHEDERTPRIAIWIDTEADGQVLDRCCTVAASIVDVATTTGTGVRLAAPTAGGELSLATRLTRAVAMRWLARLPAGGVNPVDGLRGLADEALRGVATLVLVCAPRATSDAFLDMAAGFVPLVGRVVVIPVGAVERASEVHVVAAAMGIDLLPWAEDTTLAEALTRPIDRGQIG